MADGDPHSLGTVYDRHSTRIYSHVLQLLGDPADAEDVVEETFWSAWRNARSYDPGLTPVPAWLLRMARQRAVERRKAKNRGPRTAGKDSGASAIPALEVLPGRQRQALSLALLEAMSVEEIARALDMPLSGTATALRAGLEAVGARLKPKPADVPAEPENGQ